MKGFGPDSISLELIDRPEAMGEQHRHFLPVLAIVVSKGGDQVSFLEKCTNDHPPREENVEYQSVGSQVRI